MPITIPLEFSISFHPNDNHLIHRLKATEHYDTIIELDKGRIAEQGGRHDELTQQLGCYRRKG